MITVIAEKPSVAKDIAVFLKSDAKKPGYYEGNGYFVTYAFGHLAQIKDFKELGFSGKWELSEVPFFPTSLDLKLKDDNGVRKQFKVISELFKNSKSIICATDAGREGELIFRYVYALTKSSVPFQRLWMTSLTHKSMVKCFSELKNGNNYDDLFYSAKARNEADYIVGLNATIALTAKVAAGGLLSLGRVQTPTLALICSRFISNRDFVAKPYFTPQLLLSPLSNLDFNFTSSFERNFDVKEEAQLVVNAVPNTLVVTDLVTKDVSESPPLLFNLSLLQKLANKKLGFTAQETLDIAQQLYEKHKVISYPRTSSNYLSDDFYSEIPALFSNLVSIDFKTDIVSSLLNSPLSKRPFNNDKISDHHAIIPTENIPDIAQLSVSEKHLYFLILTRFVEAFLPNCIKTATKITFQSDKGLFISTGKVVKELGWRIVSFADTSDEEKEEEEQKLPLLAVGQNVSVVKKEIISKLTKPLPVHDDSSLLEAMLNAGKLVDDKNLSSAMKENGLGTEATRASIIEVLIARKYVERDKRKLIPSKLGLSVYSLVKDLDIAKPDLTGTWEEKLLHIENGNYQSSVFNKEIQNYTSNVVASIKEMNVSDIAVQIKKNNAPEPVCKCPKCKSGDVFKGSVFFKCKNENCDFIIFTKIASTTVSDTNIVKLLKTNKSNLIKNFVSSKTNKNFEAFLILDENFKTKFEFSKK
jgi:DNA topoisomerase-3